MNKDKMKEIIKFYKRQKFRAEKKLNELKEKQLSFYGQWSKGYFEGRLSTIEGILEKLQELYEEG